MGLGHRMYKTKDPRATILQGLVEAVFEVKGSTPIYEIAKRVEHIATERLGHKGFTRTWTFTVVSSTTAWVFLWTCSRPSSRSHVWWGWLAHWKAQIIGNRIFRPTQIYTGGHDLYVPAEER